MSDHETRGLRCCELLFAGFESFEDLRSCRRIMQIVARYEICPIEGESSGNVLDSTVVVLVWNLDHEDETTAEVLDTAVEKSVSKQRCCVDTSQIRWNDCQRKKIKKKVIF